MCRDIGKRFLYFSKGFRHKQKCDAENRTAFQIKVFQGKSSNAYGLIALGYLMTFWEGGIPAGMTVLSEGSRVCLPRVPK